MDKRLHGHQSNVSLTLFLDRMEIQTSLVFFRDDKRGEHERTIEREIDMKTFIKRQIRIYCSLSLSRLYSLTSNISPLCLLPSGWSLHDDDSKVLDQTATYNCAGQFLQHLILGQTTKWERNLEDFWSVIRFVMFILLLCDLSFFSFSSVVSFLFWQIPFSRYYFKSSHNNQETVIDTWRNSNRRVNFAQIVVDNVGCWFIPWVLVFSLSLSLFSPISSWLIYHYNSLLQKGQTQHIQGLNRGRKTPDNK
jgi:hypothetical protein